MGLISSGIERVRVFEIPSGIWADGDSVESPRQALVRWYSTWSDKLHQIYVNGSYSGTTVDYHQREMLVCVPTSLATAVRIEVFAVDAEDAVTEFDEDIGSSYGQMGRVRVTLGRNQELPHRGSMLIYSNGGTGSVDYDNGVSGSGSDIWPGWQDKGGFGLGRYGVNDLGYDSAAAIGFGRGSFGRSSFGFDADTFDWVSGSLDKGTYRFGIKIVDEAGNVGAACETDEITVVAAAKPAEQVSVDSFDSVTNQLVLDVS